MNKHEGLYGYVRNHLSFLNGYVSYKCVCACVHMNGVGGNRVKESTK